MHKYICGCLNIVLHCILCGGGVGWGGGRIDCKEKKLTADLSTYFRTPARFDVKMEQKWPGCIGT